MENKELWDTIKRLIEEKKEIQQRLDIVEKILHSRITIIGNKKEK